MIKQIHTGLLVLTLGLSVTAPATEVLTEGEYSAGDGVVPVTDGLVIRLALRDGTREDNKNFRFMKATFSRDDGSFHVWCDQLRGLSRTEGNLEKVTLDCNKSVATVSNDDDESLLMSIQDAKKITDGVTTWEKSASVEYYGDGTFLGNEASLLLGPSYDEMDRTYPLLGDVGTDAAQDPLALGHAVQAQINRLLQETLYVLEADAEHTPIKVSWSMDKTMNVSINADFKVLRETLVHQSVQGVSILEEAGNLSSGYALDKVVERIKAAFAAARP